MDRGAAGKHWGGYLSVSMVCVTLPCSNPGCAVPSRYFHSLPSPLQHATPPACTTRNHAPHPQMCHGEGESAGGAADPDLRGSRQISSSGAPRPSAA
eukprot:scaffold1335_cov102-Isochrysis_galbana.AAC.7